jgi:hypothetical protein
MPSQANMPENQFLAEARMSDVNRGSPRSSAFADAAREIDV